MAEEAELDVPKDEAEERVRFLEKKKADLLEKISKLNGRLRYKQHEQKGLEPFLEKTKDVMIGSLRKELRQLEFRISTQAYTPKIEKDLIKRVKQLEEELTAVAEVEKARRKKKLIEGDILDINKEIADIEPELKKIREELNDHYDSVRAAKKVVSKGIKSDHLVTLEDIAVFEKEE
jgi:uncharacterized coiled-coil DUF342 family protein